MLSSILVASFALACSPKTPEDRIVKVIEEISAKVEKTTDCEKLVKDLNTYCKSVSDQLAADSKEVMPASMADMLNGEPTAAQEKIKAAMDKNKKLEAACLENKEVQAAVSSCIEPMMRHMK